MKLFQYPDRQRHREQLTAAVLQQVRDAIQEELAYAPASFSPEELEAIEDALMSNTLQIVDALSIEEMHSTGALVSHIANARQETSRMIRDRRPPDAPGRDR